MLLMDKLTSQVNEIFEEKKPKGRLAKSISLAVQLVLAYYIVKQTGHIYYLLTDPC